MEITIKIIFDLIVVILYLWIFRKWGRQDVYDDLMERYNNAQKHISLQNTIIQAYKQALDEKESEELKNERD